MICVPIRSAIEVTLSYVTAGLTTNDIGKKNLIRTKREIYLINLKGMGHCMKYKNTQIASASNIPHFYQN